MPRCLWAWTHSSHTACSIWCFFFFLQISRSYTVQCWLWNISVKYFHCLFPSPSQRMQMFRCCAIFFFSLVCWTWAVSHLSRFASSSLGGKTSLVALFTSSSERVEGGDSLRARARARLVNSDRSCWVCDCCSVSVVQVCNGLGSASWLLFQWYFLNVSLFVYKHYFVTYATS